MPATTVYVYADAGNVSPFRTFALSKRFPRKAVPKFIALLDRLKAFGSELRRPIAAPLADGIHELRADHQNVEYRILYFFDGANVVVISHAIAKPGAAVKPGEIVRAAEFRDRYVADRAAHRYAFAARPAAGASTREIELDDALRDICPESVEHDDD